MRRTIVAAPPEIATPGVTLGFARPVAHDANTTRRSATRTIVPLTLAAALFLDASILSGCSVYMEATRPTPVDLSQFQPGQTHDAVVEQLGAPTGKMGETDGATCEGYKLYTHGYGAGGKVPIALLEGAADVFTLGLAEAVTTPVEAATKNQLHVVTFCYRNDKLVRVSEDGHELASTTAASTTAASTGATVDSPLAASTPEASATVISPVGMSTPAQSSTTEHAATPAHAPSPRSGVAYDSPPSVASDRPNVQ